MSKEGEEEESDKGTEEKKAEDRNEKQDEKIIGEASGKDATLGCGERKEDEFARK